MHPLTHSKKPTILALLIALTLVCFGLLPNARATDTNGALPNGNNADGIGVLTSLTSGAWNSGFGFEALNQDTTGSLNTATGLRALFNNTEGDANTANGMMALFSNTTGESNVAIGAQALVFNIDGGFNTAVGTQALSSNTTALGNTAVGAGALFNNTEGNQNVAIGNGALFSNTTGSLNIALGWSAGQNLTTGNNNIDIFNLGVAGESNTIRIGTSPLQTATYIAGVSGATTSGGVAVFVDTDGKLGTLTSSARFKDEIKPMDKASEAILALKPVTFRYKKEIDPKNIPQFGLVAEDVAKVHPDLVARDAKGELYTVRYEAVNAMLLNEFLKEHRTVQEQKATIAELKSTVAKQEKGLQTVTARLEQQAAQIQKVSAQLEGSKPAPQVVENP